MRKLLSVRFVRNVAMTGGAQASQALLAMISTILVARVLGADARGVLAVLAALAAMSVVLASLGIHLSGIYFLGRFKDEREAVISNNLFAGVVGGIATAAGLAAVGVLFKEGLIHGIEVWMFLVYVTAVPFYYFNEFARRVLLGDGRVAAFNVPDLIGGSGLFIGTGAAILLFGSELVPLVVLRVVLEACTAAVLIVLLRRTMQFRMRPSRSMMGRQLRYGLKNYMSSLMWLLLLQSDIVLCNHFLGNGETGIYSIAVSLGLPITMLAGVVGTLTFQRVSAEESRERRVAQTNRAVRVLVPLVAVAMVVVGLGANWLIPVVYGAEFDPAGLALILLLPGLFAYSLEIVLMNFLAGEGSPLIVAWGPAVGLVVNVVANLFVIPRFGINGASVTSSVSYTIVLLLVFVYYLRSTGSSPRQLLLVNRDDLSALVGARRTRRTAEATAA